MKISVPGSSQDGYILIDILIGLLVAMIGFGSVFGALITAVNHTVKSESAFLLALDERNLRSHDFEKNFTFE